MLMIEALQQALDRLKDEPWIYTGVVVSDVFSYGCFCIVHPTPRYGTHFRVSITYYPQLPWYTVDVMKLEVATLLLRRLDITTQNQVIEGRAFLNSHEIFQVKMSELWGLILRGKRFPGANDARQFLKSIDTMRGV